MSNFYGVTTSLGSNSYSGYLNAPVLGPLSTNQYPNARPYSNYGSLSGIRPTPPQFFPGQEPNNSDYSVIPRQQFLRTNVSRLSREKQRELAILTTPLKSFSYSTGRSRAISQHMNYITPPPSSMYTSAKKAKAVGQMNYKINLPIDALLSTKNYNPSTIQSAVKRVRSGGCVAPKKKGAIENYSLRSGGICGWGVIPRQGY
jgi:hypothetical protein